MDFKPRVACFAVCALLLGAARPAGARGSPSEPPRCTVIAVQMLDTLDSSKAHVGDFFRFQTINAVVRGNDIIFPAHTSGWGVVSVAVPAGKGGRAGSLVLEPLYFKMPDGNKVGVALDHNAGDLQASGASNNLPHYLGAIPVVGVGAVIGAFDYFHHGKNITVHKGTIFAVFPSNDPAVAACRRTTQSTSSARWLSTQSRIATGTRVRWCVTRTRCWATSSTTSTSRRR